MRFWEVGEGGGRCVMVVEEAHSTDVNCLSWNAKESHLLVSGGDDGSIKVHACVLCACVHVGWWK